uniref:ZP domain-containing protein n=1 Tax=Ascaris lumbricoides TaxID=6252 RepID=A0A9J2P2K1_ASCLU
MYSLMLLVLILPWVSAVRSVPKNRVVCTYVYLLRSYVSAELVCTELDMQLHIVLERPIRGTVRAFVKERSEDLACSHLYSQDGDHNALTFKIPLGTCSMQKNQQSMNRFSFSTTVYFSFHSLFVSKDDVAYRITCDYAQQIPETIHNVTAGVGVREIEESNVDERSNEDVECSYSVRKAGSEIGSRESTAYANLGDEIVHEWSCAKMLPTQFIFVHDCIVNPEFDTGNDPVIVDSQGCVMDELAMGAIKYSKDGRSASSHHFAYKFADYPNLLFKCSISICDRDYAICSYKDGSPLLEPPECALVRESRSIGTASWSGNTSVGSTNTYTLSTEVHIMEGLRPTSVYVRSGRFAWITVLLRALAAPIFVLLILLTTILTVHRVRTIRPTKTLTATELRA